MHNKTIVFLSCLMAMLFIGPFLYVSNYVFLSLDDFCRAALDPTNYFLNIKDWYLHHNGRYVNAVFTLLPVYVIGIYRVLIAIQFFITGVILYNFLHFLFRLYNLKLPKAEVILLAVFLFVVLLGELPSIYDFFYWYASVTVYLFSFFLFILFLKYALNFYFKEEGAMIPWALIVIGLTGNNEMMIGVVCFSLLGLLTLYYFRYKKWSIKLLVLNLISLTSSLVVIFSPGSFSRREKFEYGGHFLGSIKVSIMKAPQFLLESLFSFPAFLFYSILFVMSLKYFKLRKGNTCFNPLWGLGVSLAGVALMFFVLFFAIGTLGVDQGRIGNFISAIIIIIISVNLVNLAAFIGLKYSLELFKWRPVYLYAFIGLSLIYIGTLNQNYSALRKDFMHGELENFRSRNEKRISRLRSVDGGNIHLERIEETGILRSVDSDINEQEWVRNCYLRYLNKAYDVNLSNIHIN